MKTLFKQLKFNRKRNFHSSVQDGKWEFFIPGVNSGVYVPASLHIRVLLEELEAGFFKLKTKKSYGDITLTPNEFDELFEEMKKIKQLRDSVEGAK